MRTNEPAPADNAAMPHVSDPVDLSGFVNSKMARLYPEIEWVFLNLNVRNKVRIESVNSLMTRDRLCSAFFLDNLLQSKKWQRLM
jgi:hypothetical protein